MYGSGQVYAWGANYYGQLGVGSSRHDQHVPALVIIEFNTTQVAGGETQTCFLSSAGEVRCAGIDNQGQIGDGGYGSTTHTPVAVDVGLLSEPGTTTFVSIAAGNRHTCATATDDKVYCWGENNYNRLGSTLDNQNRPTPVIGIANVRSMWAGYFNTFVIDNSTSSGAVAFGADYYGVFGLGSLPAGSKSATPVQLGLNVTGIVEIRGGNKVTCILKQSGEVWCTGNGSEYGQFGLGTCMTSSKTLVQWGMPCTGQPTLSPTSSQPTQAPTISQPTSAPTYSPSSRIPTHAPTSSQPTLSPTSSQPTQAPTSSQPTQAPTSSQPTNAPTYSPTSSIPTHAPTSSQPTYSPTSSAPTSSPTSSAPTMSPTSSAPTQAPTSSQPTSAPTYSPTSSQPTNAPTFSPTSNVPTAVPTSSQPTSAPTYSPTSSIPTRAPVSSAPSGAPTSSQPTSAPTSSQPTGAPSNAPVSTAPSDAPSNAPVSSSPSNVPSKTPVSSAPSDAPSKAPVSSAPTSAPAASTLAPSTAPVSAAPTSAPAASTFAPSTAPASGAPTAAPGSSVTDAPSTAPVSATSAPTPPANSKCRPVVGTNKAGCATLAKTCTKSKVTMFWAGAGCRVNGKLQHDGGCQCRDYCGYTCSKACMLSSRGRCTWNKTLKVCTVAKTGKPYVPRDTQYCPLD